MAVTLNVIETTTELGLEQVEVVLASSSEPGPAGPGVPTGGTINQVLTKDSATDFDTSWQDAQGGGGGAPTDADYLVGTASGSLSAEIVVGTSPGGELGGTWASPTVDATHSGSSHASVQAAAEATAAAALAAHDADTTGIHGIANTANLETAAGAQAKVDTHSADTTSVHGIADTSVLATDSEVATAVSDHSADTTSVHGIADTSALALTANHPTTATFNDHSARHENGGADEISIAGLDGIPTELTNHLNDASDAHDASAISYVGGTGMSATDVEAAIDELANEKMDKTSPLSLVGTTIASLPDSPADGQIAWVRAGASPFDFTAVIYDSTYAKWVSINTWLGWSKTAAGATTTSTTYVGISTANHLRGLLPWQVFVDAGLLWQFRLIGQIQISNAASTVSAGMLVVSADLNGDLATDGTHFGVLTHTGGVTGAVKDSGWVDLPGGLTVKDYIFPNVESKTSNGAHTATVLGCQVLARLVAAAA